jgi:hypothetical protein
MSQRFFEPDPAALERRDLARAAGCWLNDHAWDFFATLSFREPMRQSDADRLFRSVWIRRLDWHAKQANAWAQVTSSDEAEIRVHIHALVDSRGRLSSRILESAWSFGHTRIVRFDPQRGAAFYLANHLRDPGADLATSTRPLRRRCEPS